MIYFIRWKKRLWLFHLLLLLPSYPFLAATFSISLRSNSDNALKVLSQNAEVFNLYKYDQKVDTVLSERSINWLVDYEADVKCVQEYYCHSGSTVFNVPNQMNTRGYSHYVEKIILRNTHGGKFGLAIFSKYPIVNSGEIRDERGNYQKAHYADIQLPDNSVVRIYNVHLQSMAIDEDSIFESQSIRESYNYTSMKLKDGFSRRAQQVDHLIKSVSNCPYPVILCGDLNEVPYSYVYFRLKKSLQSSFEAAGNGFGYSYNGRLFFLRIDHQFYSDKLQALDFKTLRSVKFSDHFPIVGSYTTHKK